jgi:hypothetical protein
MVAVRGGEMAEREGGKKNKNLAVKTKTFWLHLLLAFCRRSFYSSRSIKGG